MRPQRGSLLTLVILVLTLLLATAARLYHIQTQSIWFDEGWSAFAAICPTLLDAWNADTTNPPLYYVLLNVAVRGFGDSELALRWFSTLWGLIAIALAYRLARDLFAHSAGVFAAFLVTASPLLWWASQEARMYTLMAVLILGAALAWHRIIRPHPKSLSLKERDLQSPGLRWWVVLWGCELALLYTHNTGPVAALWLNAVTVMAWIIGRLTKLNPLLSLSSPTRWGWDGDINWRLWIAGQVGVALLWLPYYLNRYALLTEANSAVTSAPTLNPALMAQLWGAFWASSWTLVRSELTTAVIAIIALVIALGCIPWRLAAARWLVLHVAVLTAGVIAGLIILGNEMHGRYLVMVVPLLLVAIGAGLARLRPAALAYGAAAVFAVIFGVNVSFAQNPLYQHDDVRAMVRYYADQLDADDTVLAWSYADRYDLAYYWDRLGVKARRTTLPEGADLETILPLLPTSGDVALNVWYTQRADYRGMMGCVLQHGRRELPEQFTVYGMTTLLYRNLVFDMPQLRRFDATFTVAQVTEVGHFPPFTADRALCLPIQMMLTQPVQHPLKAAVIVKNSLGWEISRTDAVFAQADQRTSNQLSPGAVLTAYPLVELDYGTPPGEYPVILRLYTDVNTSGYDTLPPHGKDVVLGHWSVLPGAVWTRTSLRYDVVMPLTVHVADDLTLRAYGPGPTLFGNQVPTADILAGSMMEATLLWEGQGELPTLILADESGRWQIDVPPLNYPARDHIIRDWRSVRVPADAESGTAELRLPDGTVLATYTIEALPGEFVEPPFDTAVGVEVPGVGTLVGFTLMGDSFDRSQPVPLRLVWRAGATPDTSYTVFAQLLDTAGRLIAQSDALPAGGSRPTTGWRAGEYIVDSHQLRFNEAAQPGTATLIVGMYDAMTGTRIRLADGTDAIRLRGEITVK